MKYVHSISGSPLFAEVARKAIKDEYGRDINDTYLKKVDLTFQYDEDNEIVGINNSAIAAAEGSLKLVGDDGIYVRNDLTANIIGISAHYATVNQLNQKQDKLSDDQMTDIYSIPFKLDKFEFAALSGDFATKEDLTNKADVTAINTIYDKLNTIEPSAQRNVQSNWTETNTASDAFIKNKPDIYTKAEVDSLLDGKIVIVDELPITGESGKIYYLGPIPSVTGDDKYDEYIWNENTWLKVGEHSLDLDDYATYEYVDSTLDTKQDTLTFGLVGNTLTSINEYFISGTSYVAGNNIDITNNVISGKDWSTDIRSAVSGLATSQELEDLSEEMAEGFADMESRKVDVSSYTATISDLTSAISDKLSKTEADTYYQPIGNYLTATALEPYSANWNTAYNILLNNSGKWNDKLDTTAFEAYTATAGDIPYSAGSGIGIDHHIISVTGAYITSGELDPLSSKWEDASDWVSANSSIGVITKDDIDDMWNNITANSH